MRIQKTRNEGGSTVVVIPRAYCRELGIVPGDYVSMRPDHSGHLVIGKLEEYVANRDQARTRSRRPDR